MPTEAAVERLVAVGRGDNAPLPPISPRQVIPTLRSLAANAVMAGCRPEYFPVVLAALRGVLTPEYNLHGTLATTHPCAPMVLVNGPLRERLGINCGGNCFGQGWRANATIGRALELILLNIGGAKPAVMDRSTQGSPAKYSFCFGENEEASPWEPYHVRRGFDPSDSVVTVMSGEGPHNINDHASTTGDGLLTTMSASIAQPGANTIYGKGPYVVVIGPEHAATLHRDGWTIPALQQALYERARVPLSSVSPENRAQYRRIRTCAHSWQLPGLALARGHPHSGRRRRGQAFRVDPVIRRHRRLLGARPAAGLGRVALDSDEAPLFADTTALEDVQRRLEALGLGDGLPLVPPTARRMERMLAGVVDPDRSYGLMPPLLGEVTAERAAYQCVLAGCIPAELPVVLTAAVACLAPAFNLLGIQTTTGTPTVAVLVHGPVARELGMNAGPNCLGPGNRANGCIGRALQLLLRNVGGARPGIGDMATMGQPGKYTFCFAEGADDIWPALHARRGIPAEESAVTVLGVSGTMEVLPGADGRGPEAILQPMLAAMRGARAAGDGGRVRPGGEHFLLLPPEVAQLLAESGWRLGEIRSFLSREERSISTDDIHPVLTGGAGVKMTYLPLWAGGTRSVSSALVQP